MGMILPFIILATIPIYFAAVNPWETLGMFLKFVDLFFLNHEVRCLVV